MVEIGSRVLTTPKFFLEESYFALAKHITSIPEDDLWHHFSSYHHLIRITCWLLCFIHNSRSLNNERVSSLLLLTAEDTIKAETASLKQWNLYQEYWQQWRQEYSIF